MEERRDQNLERRLTKQDLLGYKVNLVWRSPIPFDPYDEAIDVRLILRDGRHYASNFVTRKFIDKIFKKNKLTGECVGGTYFAMPGMIVVDRINEGTVKATIDDMTNNGELENYFTCLSRD